MKKFLLIAIMLALVAAVNVSAAGAGPQFICGTGEFQVTMLEMVNVIPEPDVVSLCDSDGFYITNVINETDCKARRSVLALRGS